MAKTSKTAKTTKTAKPVVKMTKALQSRIVKAKAASTPKNAGESAMAKLFSAPEAAQVKVHADGTIEKLDRVTMDQIAYFLKGKRAFDGAEVMEELNRDCIALMLNAGYIVDRANGQSKNVKSRLFYVTTKAAERFKLRPVTTFGLNFKFIEA